jgi:hypothetical protein
MMQVIFFPWITKSPGNLPRGILVRENRYERPARTRKMTPIIRNILESVGSIPVLVNKLEQYQIV